MKQRLLNVLKWFFIVLGVFYLIQVIFVSGALVGLIGLTKIDFNKFENISKKNSLNSVINYIEDYKIKNNAYPKNLEGAKLNKKSAYNYELSKEGNCYTIKETTKDNVVKEYRRCSSNSSNSSMNTQSYIEYKN